MLLKLCVKYVIHTETMQTISAGIIESNEMSI